MKAQAIVEKIVELTAKALSEEDKDKFAQCLRERGALLAKVVGKDIQVKEVTLKSWLEHEQGVLARLEEAKQRVLREMDEVSAKKKAMHRYSPQPPDTSTPAFIDKTG